MIRSEVSLDATSENVESTLPGEHTLRAVSLVTSSQGIIAKVRQN